MWEESSTELPDLLKIPQSSCQELAVQLPLGEVANMITKQTASVSTDSICKTSSKWILMEVIQSKTTLARPP